MNSKTILCLLLGLVLMFGFSTAAQATARSPTTEEGSELLVPVIEAAVAYDNVAEAAVNGTLDEAVTTIARVISAAPTISDGKAFAAAQEDAIAANDLYEDGCMMVTSSESIAAPKTTCTVIGDATTTLAIRIYRDEAAAVRAFPNPFAFTTTDLDVDDGLESAVTAVYRMTMTGRFADNTTVTNSAYAVRSRTLNEAAVMRASPSDAIREKNAYVAISVVASLTSETE